MTDRSDQLATEVTKELDLAEASEAYMTLSNGVKLRVAPPPVLAVQLMTKQNPAPRPPVVEVTGDDGRTWKEENPNDPDYQDAVQEHRENILETTLKVMLLKSTFVEFLPEQIIPLESDEWVEELEYLGVEIPEDSRSRKLYWLRYEILGVPKDFEKYQNISARLGGMEEEDIAAAEERFRSLSERDAGEGLVEL